MATTTNWTVQIEMTEDGEDTTARAMLMTDQGTPRDDLIGTGRSRRNPNDQEVPAIGEEVAAARALRDLAARLLGAASEDISAIEHHEVHLVR